MKTTRRRVQCNSMDISQDPRKFKGERGRRQVGLKEYSSKWHQRKGLYSGPRKEKE